MTNSFIPTGEPHTDPAAAAAAIAGGTTQPPEAPATPPATTGTSDAFETPFNLNDVPEEVREYVDRYNKQLQGAYTRKTQELAEQRKALEPNNALLSRLQSDDETTRDAAVREALKLGRWEDLSAQEQQAAAD